MDTFVLHAAAPAHPCLILTTALAYSNARLHLGHALEALLADAFARHRRAWGQDVVFLGGDDNHGTATELRAQARGTTPEALVEEVYTHNTADYAALGIGFSLYHRTHSAENAAVVAEAYARLRAQGRVLRITSPRLYDAAAGRFLEDRRVRGTCPSCGRHDQHGGGCTCGATVDAVDLLDPVSVLTGTRPEIRDAEHLHLDVDASGDRIRGWLAQGAVAAGVAAKLRAWTHASIDVSNAPHGAQHLPASTHNATPTLAHTAAPDPTEPTPTEPHTHRIRPWCITRSGPTFGFPVPGEQDLFFYVWFDAPLGYLAALDAYAAQHQDGWSANRSSDPAQDGTDPGRGHGHPAPSLPGQHWRRLWDDPSHEIVQVVGKDIVAFHGVFWPALLDGLDARLPDRVHAHGFLTRGGEKLSKSSGTAPTLESVLAALPADAVRLGLAARAGVGTSDGDLEEGVFAALHDGLLVGKIANAAQRLRPFLARVDGRLADRLPDPAAYQDALDEAAQAIAAYEAFDTAKAVRVAAALADRINAGIAADAPWTATDTEALRATLTQAFALLRVVATVLAPITTGFSARLLGCLHAPRDGATGSAPQEDTGGVPRDAAEGTTKVVTGCGDDGAALATPTGGILPPPAWGALTTPPLGWHVEVPHRLLERIG